MIPNYSDPIVTLNQVYKASQEGSQPVLGACIIGPHYIVRKYEDFKEKLRMTKNGGTYNGSAITDNAYPLYDKVNQPPIDTNKEHLKIFVKNAYLKYATYTSDSQLQFDNNNRRRLVIEDNDNGSSYILFQDSDQTTVDVAPGDIVRIAVGAASDSYTVREIERNAQGMATICVLDKQVPSGNVSDVTFYRITDCYVKATSYSVDSDSWSIDASAVSAEIDIGGGKHNYTIAKGDLYVQYRYLSKAYANKYSFVSGIDYVEDALGKICDENPLGIAVANAVEQANGNFVYFVATDGDVADQTTNQIELVQLYKNAADLIADKDNIYGIVPCTQSKAVALALLQFIEKQSAEQIPYFKYLYASKQIPSDSLSNGKKKKNSVLIQQLKDWKQGYTDKKPIANRRCSVIIADGAVYNSTIPVKNYCVAAALAGKRSGTYPHAPLSNVALKAITCSETHGFTASQSKALGAVGFWRVGMREDGECISRRQLTSAATGDVNYDEQSIVCNIDSIGLSLKVTGRDLVGNTNISPVLINILEAQLNNKLDQYKTYVNSLIGPQLLEGSIISIKQDAIYKDRIYADLEGQPPKPFNRFHITFYMK